MGQVVGVRRSRLRKVSEGGKRANKSKRKKEAGERRPLCVSSLTRAGMGICVVPLSPSRENLARCKASCTKWLTHETHESSMGSLVYAVTLLPEPCTDLSARFISFLGYTQTLLTQHKKQSRYTYGRSDTSLLEWADAPE